jgi:stage V sporulation protein B
MNTFFKGTLLLAVAAFAGECIEFLVNMVLARELGENGLGMYMSILPTIFLVVLLASFELPIAISKFIAEKDKKYHQSMLNHVIKLTVIFTAVLMPLAMLIMPFLTIFDQYHPYLRWVVIAFIPIVSFSSITRGFFMGKNQMGKIATYNFLRKLVQLLFLVFLYQFFQFDTKTSVFIAFCTLIGSEVVVFLYLLHMFIIQFQQVKKEPSEGMSGKTVRRSLMAVSIPTTAMRVFHALTHAIEPFLIKAALLQAGVSGVVATEHFGMLAGIAMTIGFFPAFIAHSFLIMLIPTVSKAYADKDNQKLQSLLQQVFKVTILYGIPAVTLFYFFAEPITKTFFHSADAAVYLQMLWPFFLLHYFIIPMQAFLIGIGLMKETLYHFLWSTVVSFSVMYLLGSKHTFQMDGVIIGMNAGAVVLYLMHYLTICKKIGVTILLAPIKRFH